jgi:hypothetical protein
VTDVAGLSAGVTAVPTGRPLGGVAFFGCQLGGRRDELPGGAAEQPTGGGRGAAADVCGG